MSDGNGIQNFSQYYLRKGGLRKQSERKERNFKISLKRKDWEADKFSHFV